MAGESAEDVARRQREKAARLVRSAERWEQGAAGERATAAVLEQLPAAWVVLHDLKWPGRQRANVDHLVIGPGGAFVIDSKLWSGEIVVDDAIRQNGRLRDLTTGVRAAATAVHGSLLPDLADVGGVVCFVREEPIAGVIDGVLVCSTASLLEMLLSRPEVLTGQQVDFAAAILRRPAPAAAYPSSGPIVPPPAPVRATGRRRAGVPKRHARRRGRHGQWLNTVVAIGVLVGLLAFVHHEQTMGRQPNAPGHQCPAATSVKATTTAAGAHIYRLRSWPRYSAMKADRCFATPAAAAAAGYRPDRRAGAHRKAR